MNKIENFNLNTHFKVSEDVFHSEIKDEIVILNLKSGIYFGLDPIGTTIWSLLTQSKTVAEICSFLIKEYEVFSEECDRDLQELLQELTAANLIEVVGEQAT